jgi:hypothetical protein
MDVFKKNGLWGLIICLLLPVSSLAQKDTTLQKKDSSNIIQTIKNSRLGRELERSIRSRPFSDTSKQERSEDKLIAYEGKIIRRIHIEHIGFNKSIYNPDKTIKSVVTNFANSLHTDTREEIIRQHLFFYEGNVLNPYRLADNERYLRDLDFVLDSRIIVEPIESSQDSVDVHIITRDVFSLGGRIRPRLDRFKIGAYDANLFGLGQRIEATMLYQIDRSPQTGLSVAYRKSSLLGSLANLTLGYTQLDNGSSYGNENEYSYYGRVDRPLVSPYSRWAGGIEVSRNWSKNVFKSPDSLFLNYRYNVQDYWMGYNMGIRNNMNDRTRHFVALRYFQQQFLRQPFQPYENENPIYNSRQMLLASITYYERNFYKTNYIYGFGRTEDVPYGTSMTFTTGWSRELRIERPYFSLDANKSFVGVKGNFYTLRGALGTYWKNKGAQDVLFLASANIFSRLIDWKNMRVRQSIEVGYSQIFKQRTSELLTLNNQVKGFSPDSLFGTKRLYARSETTLFTPWSFLGFRFAPFAAFEGGVLRQKTVTASFTKLYPGFSTGVRTRNENLIFGTLEARVFYFPIRVDGVSYFEFKFTSNLRIKYSGGFVRAPGLLIYN